MLDRSNCKPNKICVDKGSEFYNRSMESFLQNNDIETYSACNEGKSVVAERFIRTLQKIYKYMTSLSKKVYIDKLDDIVNKYNNTYHSTIKMKPVDVKSDTYIESSKEINNKNRKFKVDDIVRISKYKNMLVKVTVQIGQKKILWLKKLKALCSGHILLMLLKEKKLSKRFTKKNCKKQFRIEKVIKRKDNKLYITWKGYNNSFNSWIHRKDIVWMRQYFPKPKVNNVSTTDTSNLV